MDLAKVVRQIEERERREQAAEAAAQAQAEIERIDKTYASGLYAASEYGLLETAQQWVGAQAHGEIFYSSRSDGIFGMALRWDQPRGSGRQARRAEVTIVVESSRQAWDGEYVAEHADTRHLPDGGGFSEPPWVRLEVETPCRCHARDLGYSHVYSCPTAKAWQMNLPQSNCSKVHRLEDALIRHRGGYVQKDGHANSLRLWVYYWAVVVWLSKGGDRQARIGHSLPWPVSPERYPGMFAYDGPDVTSKFVDDWKREKEDRYQGLLDELIDSVRRPVILTYPDKPPGYNFGFMR